MNDAQPIRAMGMEAVAAACGYSWERFRKVWRTLPGFPAPIKRPNAKGKGGYAWRAESVHAWIAAREAALGEGRAAPPPANENREPRLAHAAARQRHVFDRLMGRA
ncbi:MAG TPA: hypothetical protein VMU59_06700 [Caulobacteraceae bacterium]|nr:hypothetical protein [Caulobacteraceae bacterium]